MSLVETERQARSARGRRAAQARQQAIESRIEADVLAYVGKHPGCVAEDLRGNITGAGVTIDRVRRRLVEQGRLHRMEGYTTTAKGGRR